MSVLVQFRLMGERQAHSYVGVGLATWCETAVEGSVGLPEPGGFLTRTTERRTCGARASHTHVDTQRGVLLCIESDSWDKIMDVLRIYAREMPFLERHTSEVLGAKL